MSVPGDPAPGALQGDRVSVAGLMALRLARDGGLPLALARRSGSTATRGAGQGHLIRDLRPFADGDDPRHIDAAASARTGQLQRRAFHEDREASLLLIADFRRPMLWGSGRRLRSVAAADHLMRLAWTAIEAGGTVGLVSVDGQGWRLTRPRGRAAGIRAVARALAEAHEVALRDRASRPLDLALVELLPHLPRGATLALASGLDDPGTRLPGALMALTRRGPLHLLLVEDAIERAAPSRAMPVHDASGRGQLVDLAPLAAARAARAAVLRQPGLQIRPVPVDGEG